MEEANQSDLALTDIAEAEQLTANEVVEREEHENVEQNQTRTHMVTTSEATGPNTVVSVPVSLPVGSLIAGTAFNVITPDQLPHFKQMLCVDNNGFISGSAVVGDVSSDLKTTHIVIQQPTSQNESIGNSNSQESNGSKNTGQHVSQSNVTWANTAHLEVLPIRCKTFPAELYKSKLGSGGRGRCIKYKEHWYTPSEFESVCGRGSSKDWKRSIRYGGRSLQALVDEGILTPHATSCTCTACCDDDSSAFGPVRLFTPYKRRRRNQVENELESVKKKRLFTSTKTEKVILPDQNIVNKEDTWETLTDGIDSTADYMDQTSNSILDASVPLKRLEGVYRTMVRATNEFKRLYLEVKDIYTRQVERLQRERDTALMAARSHADVDDQTITGQIAGNELVITKKCANCNRDALAECSSCRRTPYCSTFCQRKDWNAHQVECTRDSNEGTQQIMLLVDEQA